MHVLPDVLARAHGRELQVEAELRRRGHELGCARRLARKAERNALRARLHLARLG